MEAPAPGNVPVNIRSKTLYVHPDPSELNINVGERKQSDGYVECIGCVTPDVQGVCSYDIVDNIGVTFVGTVGTRV